MGKERILVTGGAGFIGSHTVKALINAGYNDILVVDNLTKGKKSSVLPPARLKVIDLKDKEALNSVISEFKPNIVLHFAAAKLAPESVENPKKYYIENVSNGLNLLEVMVDNNIKKIIFSSTAAVYGDVEDIPVRESSSTIPVNPYGKTKLMFEEMLKDFNQAYDINFVTLRYFNAAGADIAGELGNQSEIREDLISVLMDVATGKRNRFVINGVDYETKDGSCVRDLVHVNDLAMAHLLAIDYLGNNHEPLTVNLGSENGFTVKECVNKTKEITKIDFLVENGERREGDIVVSIASSEKAKKLLKWEASHSSLDCIIATAWKWEMKDKSTLT